MDAAGRQTSAEVVPVGRRWTRHKDLSEHGDFFISVKNLAEKIGAASLSSNHHEQAGAIGKVVCIGVRQD